MNIASLSLGTESVPSPSNLPPRPILTRSLDDPSSYIWGIDNTAYGTVRTCPRKGEYYLLERRESVGKAALDFGTAHHIALEHKYRNNGTGPITPEVKSEIVEIVWDFYTNQGGTADDWRTPSRVLDQVHAYFNHYPKESFELVKGADDLELVECPFSLPLLSLGLKSNVSYSPSKLIKGEESNTDSSFYINNLHVFFTGKIDMPVRKNGELLVLDHKTHSVGGPTYFDAYTLASQGMGYAWALEQILNERCHGFYLDAIYGRPATKGKPNNWEFNRSVYHYTPAQIEEWKQNLTSYLLTFARHLTEGFFPMNDGSCFTNYGRCSYHDVCTLPKANRPTALASPQYSNVNWSPTH